MDRHSTNLIERDVAAEGPQFACATFDIRNVKEAGAGRKRTFTGIASAITVDRMNDVVVPRGVKFKLPLPLLWQHSRKEPIGWVHAARISDTSIEVDCEVHDEKDAGELKNFLDKCWQELRAGLVRGLSIGFNPLEWSFIPGTDGIEYRSWEWIELSPVVIPAHADAGITSILRSVRSATRTTSTNNRTANSDTTMSDSTFEVRGLRLILFTPTTGRVELQLSRAYAQVLAAGLRKSAGAIGTADGHLADLATCVMATEVKPTQRRSKVIRLGR